jgi:hypothetical protein
MVNLSNFQLHMAIPLKSVVGGSIIFHFTNNRMTAYFGFI